jgi:hypothetical protein
MKKPSHREKAEKSWTNVDITAKETKTEIVEQNDSQKKSLSLEDSEKSVS